MGFFSKLFKGPEPDMEKSRANAEKMRALFNQKVDRGDDYRLIFGYTEDVSRFNYGFVHGSKTKIGNLIVGWKRSRPNDCSGSDRSGSFRLRRGGFLPPIRYFKGIPEQISYRCLCHLSG